MVEADLSRLDADAMRRAARATEGDARLAAVRTLATALGLADADGAARDVAVIAGVYFGGDDAAGDAAVSRLANAFLALDPGADQEVVANRIALLVQACDATAALIARTHAGDARASDAHAEDAPGGNAQTADAPGHDVDARLAWTLRHDPPVRTLRRVALCDTRVEGIELAAGDFVTLDVAAASLDPDAAGQPPLTFGAEPRRCPGERFAMALAAGIIERSR